MRSNPDIYFVGGPANGRLYNDETAPPVFRLLEPHPCKVTFNPAELLNATDSHYKTFLYSLIKVHYHEMGIRRYYVPSDWLSQDLLTQEGLEAVHSWEFERAMKTTEFQFELSRPCRNPSVHYPTVDPSTVSLLRVRDCYECLEALIRNIQEEAVRVSKLDPQPCHVCEARPHDTICDVCGEVVCEKCLVETIGGITVCIECQEQVQFESVTKEEP